MHNNSSEQQKRYSYNPVELFNESQQDTVVSGTTIQSNIAKAKEFGEFLGASSEIFYKQKSNLMCAQNGGDKKRPSSQNLMQDRDGEVPSSEIKG